jgi:hypothetical protein
MSRALWDVAAFVGGILVAKVAVGLGAMVRPPEGTPALAAMKDHALGAAALAGSSAMVVAYVGRRSEPAALFGAGLGVGAALEQHKWERWGS